MVFPLFLYLAGFLSIGLPNSPNSSHTSSIYSPLLYQTWPLFSSLLSTRSLPISNSCRVCSLQALTPSFLSSAKGSIPLTFQVRRLQQWLIRVRWVSECVGTHSQSLFRALGRMRTIGYPGWSDQEILFRSSVSSYVLKTKFSSKMFWSVLAPHFPTRSISRSIRQSLTLPNDKIDGANRQSFSLPLAATQFIVFIYRFPPPHFFHYSMAVTLPPLRTHAFSSSIHSHSRSAVVVRMNGGGHPLSPFSLLSLHLWPVREWGNMREWGVWPSFPSLMKSLRCSVGGCRCNVYPPCPFYSSLSSPFFAMSIRYSNISPPPPCLIFYLNSFPFRDWMLRDKCGSGKTVTSYG